MHAKRHSLAALLACSLLGAAPLAAQLEPPSSGGLAELDRLLHRIATPYRVLVIGAHPDDEDTSLLALVARGFGAGAAYLSLSRGEGGQNLIGGELGVGLGLVRSQELVSARAVDGALQFFTRAYDFGYSRSLEETEQFWLPDSVLKDAVRVVRRFRPHVMVTVWSGTPRDRHGQHQMSGVVSIEAFDAAGDPDRFPELLSEEGLAPWQPLKLYRSTRFDSAATTITLATGGLEPHTGRTYHQIAMASRSQHRSQDMGRLQRTGPAGTRLQLIRDLTGQGEDGARAGVFSGLPADTSWLASFADSLRGRLAPATLADAAPPLADALRRARTGKLDPGRLALLERALGIAAGLVVDGTTERAKLVPGEAVEVTLQCYNGGPYEARLERLWVTAPQGWRVDPLEAAPPTVAPGAQVSRRFMVTAPPGTAASQPYFLAPPAVGSLYQWSSADPALRGLPLGPPLLAVDAQLTVLDARVGLEREVSRRLQDQAVGEVRSPLRVVPAIEVTVDPGQLVWSSNGPYERDFTVTLTHNGAGSAAGSVALEADSWPMPPAREFLFRGPGQQLVFQFRVRRPPGVERGSATLWAVARAEGGEEYDAAAVEVTYPHIRPTAYVRSAHSDVTLAPIALPDARAIGYVRGAADRIPEALQQIGLSPELLRGAELAATDLERFDAIVIGPRAYETDTALASQNDRLLEYVRRGGLLLVQYQQYQFVRGEYAPYPLEIALPHDRVTDETAAVTPLVPEHPVFRRPNLLGPDDWDGWPQERGLYFAGSWDEAYVPLLEMADPGMPALRGGLLVARYGEGTYVYTGVSFFRALPGGAAGAFRLFLNLLALHD